MPRVSRRARSPSRDDAIVADRLLPLLGGRRTEQACAAALVLGALRPADPRVIRALARRLATARPAIRPYIREALARQRTDDALSVLVPGLWEAGVEREQCRRLVAGFGTRALACLDRCLREHPDEPGDRVFEVAASMRLRAAVEWLAAQLGRADTSRARALGRVLDRERLSRWPRPLRDVLRRCFAARVRAGRFESQAAVVVALDVLAAS